MTYLLAKYTLLFLLTAILGFALGYWWSRRSMVDVSESYEDLRKATDRSDKMEWGRLWKRLDALPAPEKPARVDLGPVNAKLGSLEEAIRKAPTPQPPRDVDLSAVENELTALRNTIKSIPAVETHPAADLSPMTDRITSLEQSVRSISAPKDVNLAPVYQRLDGIETELRGLGRRFAQPAVPDQPARIPAREEPVILKAALYGKKDDLKLISGVGPKLERVLNKNGIFYFWQVADWRRRDIDVIDQRLDVFKGRIVRDNWVVQAKHLSHEPGAASMPAD